MDYFTKWIEAEALSSIPEANIRRFVWQHVVCRFGVPKILMMDNGKQFDNARFRQFCTELGITPFYPPGAHPLSNGQAELANFCLLKAFRTRINAVQAKCVWSDELPSILWAYRTTPQTITGETSFLLTFGHEVVVPIKLSEPTRRTMSIIDENQNNMLLRSELDFQEEKEEQVVAQTTTYKQRLA